MTDSAKIPSFRRGVKLHFDSVRDAWMLLAPEKLFMPDDIALEILRLVDGRRTISAIIDNLSARFDAPPEAIAGDVVAVLDDLAARGAVQL